MAILAKRSNMMKERSHVHELNLLDPNGDSGVYSGQLRNKRPHGKGTMKYSDGRSYSGDWRHGCWHGHGVATFVNGDVYEGDYRYNQRHGQGKYAWSDGRVYHGGFHFNVREGRGVYSWPDGGYYVGDYKHGQCEGKGTYRSASGSVYTGTWKKGQFLGKGSLTWINGRVYTRWKPFKNRGRRSQRKSGKAGAEAVSDWSYDAPIVPEVPTAQSSMNDKEPSEHDIIQTLAKRLSASDRGLAASMDQLEEDSEELLKTASLHYAMCSSKFKTNPTSLLDSPEESIIEEVERRLSVAKSEEEIEGMREVHRRLSNLRQEQPAAAPTSEGPCPPSQDDDEGPASSSSSDDEGDEEKANTVANSEQKWARLPNTTTTVQTKRANGNRKIYRPRRRGSPFKQHEPSGRPRPPISVMAGGAVSSSKQELPRAATEPCSPTSEDPCPPSLVEGSDPSSSSDGVTETRGDEPSNTTFNANTRRADGRKVYRTKHRSSDFMQQRHDGGSQPCTAEGDVESLSKQPAAAAYNVSHALSDPMQPPPPDGSPVLVTQIDSNDFNGTFGQPFDRRSGRKRSAATKSLLVDDYDDYYGVSFDQPKSSAVGDCEPQSDFKIHGSTLTGDSAEGLDEAILPPAPVRRNSSNTLGEEDMDALIRKACQAFGGEVPKLSSTKPSLVNKAASTSTIRSAGRRSSVQSIKEEDEAADDWPSSTDTDQEDGDFHIEDLEASLDRIVPRSGLGPSTSARTMETLTEDAVTAVGLKETSSGTAATNIRPSKNSKEPSNKSLDTIAAMGEEELEKLIEKACTKMGIIPRPILTPQPSEAVLETSETEQRLSSVVKFMDEADGTRRSLSPVRRGSSNRRSGRGSILKTSVQYPPTAPSDDREEGAPVQEAPTDDELIEAASRKLKAVNSNRTVASEGNFPHRNVHRKSLRSSLKQSKRASGAQRSGSVLSQEESASRRSSRRVSFKQDIDTIHMLHKTHAAILSLRQQYYLHGDSENGFPEREFIDSSDDDVAAGVQHQVAPLTSFENPADGDGKIFMRVARTTLTIMLHHALRSIGMMIVVPQIPRHRLAFVVAISGLAYAVTLKNENKVEMTISDIALKKLKQKSKLRYGSTKERKKGLLLPILIAFGLLLMHGGGYVGEGRFRWSYWFWGGEALLIAILTYTTVPASLRTKKVFYCVIGGSTSLALCLRGDLSRYITFVMFEALVAVVTTFSLPSIATVLRRATNQELKKVGMKIGKKHEAIQEALPV